MIIEPRLIMHMLAIGKYGSISKAAAALRMSQPALSNGVALLEQQLGVKVLERSRHGSRPTECGLAVVRCADAVDSHINSLLEEIKVRAEGSAGTLKIGVSPVVSYSFVPQAVADITDQMPSLTMSIREASDDQLTELMTSGKIDLSICPVGVAPQRTDISEERLFTDPFSILVRKGHRLSRAKSVSVSDIINEQWILPHFGSAKRLQVEAIFLTCGFPVPPNSIITNSTDMIEALLIRTDRVAIVSDWVIRNLDPKKYSRIAIQHIGAPRTIGVKRLRKVQPSPSAEAFITILRKQASSIGLPFIAAKSEQRYRAKGKRKQGH
jgi:DNA-binding transcriptional LysR family regulator